MEKTLEKSAEKPKKMGRRPVPDDVRRDKWLTTVRFSAVDLELIERQAKRAKMTVTAWVRSRLGL